MNERQQKPMRVPFVIAFTGLLVAALLNRWAGTAIFCAAGLYVTVQYVLIAFKTRSAGKYELAWNLGVAAVFATFTYVAARAMLG